MALTALPVALMGVGTGLQIIGALNANRAQAAQARINAQFYEKQAELAKFSMERAQRLANAEWATKAGQQLTAYAGSGIDTGSGSAAITVGGTVGQALDELWAIKKKGDLDVELAMLRARGAQGEASSLESFGTNFMQGASTLIGNYARSDGFGAGYGYAKYQPNGVTPYQNYQNVFSGAASSSAAGTLPAAAGTYESQYFGTIGG